MSDSLVHSVRTERLIDPLNTLGDTRIGGRSTRGAAADAPGHNASLNQKFLVIIKETRFFYSELNYSMKLYQLTINKN